MAAPSRSHESPLTANTARPFEDFLLHVFVHARIVRRACLEHGIDHEIDEGVWRFAVLDLVDHVEALEDKWAAMRILKTESRDGPRGF
jgi:hypothetical protein